MSSLPELSQFSFFHALRVRWAEVDPQSIVFNGHYLTYADVAITDFMLEVMRKRSGAQLAATAAFSRAARIASVSGGPPP